MSCARLPASAVALLGLLLALASVVLNSGNCGLQISLSRLCNVSNRGTAKASDAAVGVSDSTTVGKVGGGRGRKLFSWGRGSGGSNGERRRARLAFFIMSSGDDAAKLELLLPEIYHKDNVYLVHVDAKAPQDQTDNIRKLVEANFPARDGRPPNGRMLEPAGIISWGGFSITLACLYGIAAALLWDDKWDYFINLSASDFPVMTQDEMKLFLGGHADSGVSFMEGALMTGFEKRWQGYTEDQGVQRHAGDHTEVAMKMLGWIDRPYPQRFRLYKGEFWGIFHRSFCEYTSWSPDNVARTLAAYFTGYRISDESYFQTLACHDEGKTFPIHGDNFRFASWNEHHKDSQGRKVDANGDILIHPEPLAMVSVEKIKTSGAIFARKFDFVKSREVYAAMQKELRDSDRHRERLDQARARFQHRAGDKEGRENFCGSRKGVRRRALPEEGETPEEEYPTGPPR
eukprot:g16334.t1